MQHALPFAAPPPCAVRRRAPAAHGAWHGGTAPPPDAADIARGAVRLLESMRFRTLTELRLASGQRVDVIGLDGRGRFAVAEVKSGLADLRADVKWPGYLPFCDWFYFAVGPGFPLDSLPEEAGIIIADGYRGEVVRAAPGRRMNTAARRRQTLIFAHAASARLRRLLNAGAAPPLQPGE